MNTNFTVVNRSSKQCEEFNTLNKDAIEAGLISPQSPSQSILDDEAKQREREHSQLIREKNAGLFWQLVISLLSDEDKKVFSNDHGMRLSVDSKSGFHLYGEIEKYITYGYSRLHPKGSYIRVIIGDNSWGAGKSIFKFKNQENIHVDTDTAQKVAKRITQELKEQRIRQQQRIQQQTMEVRREQFFKDNEATFKSFGIYYASKLSATQDPNKYGAQIFFTGTIEEWVALKEYIDSKNLR